MYLIRDIQNYFKVTGKCVCMHMCIFSSITTFGIEASQHPFPLPFSLSGTLGISP